MRLVLGNLNGTFLRNLMTQSYPACTSIQAAVAYADFHEPFVEHIKQHPALKIDFYGRLDHDEAVSLRLLRWFLQEAPSTVQCHLVRGAYHPKVIWWHGYGAYVGSANLTPNGWHKNIECGVFFTQDDLADQELIDDLEVMFEKIDQLATSLTEELYARLEKVAAEKAKLKQRLESFDKTAEDLLAGYTRFEGLTRYASPTEKKPSKAQLGFVAEWRETLQLLRTLRREFESLALRPSWVPKDANPTVHFDQLLHGFYYHEVLKSYDEGDSMSKVNRLFEQNKSKPHEALAEAARWWASLKEGPSKVPSSSRYDEEAFIRDRAPRMAELFSAESLAEITEDAFVEAMSNVHAFREHARQVQNAVYGLPPDHHESEDGRAERFARLIWGRRTKDGKTVVDLLLFVIYGDDPPEAEERLWLADRSKTWKLQGLGPSTLGEVLGWARPDKYPPRNDRTNKALRALGHEVRVFNPGKSRRRSVDEPA